MGIIRRVRIHGFNVDSVEWNLYFFNLKDHILTEGEEDMQVGDLIVLREMALYAEDDESRFLVLEVENVSPQMSSIICDNLLELKLRLPQPLKQSERADLKHFYRTGFRD